MGEPRIANRTTRRLIFGAAGTVVLALAVLVGLALYSHAYHRSPWDTVPTQVTACGRDYIYPDHSHPQSRAAASRSADTTLRQVASTPGWVRTREIWGHRYDDRDSADDRCGTTVWVRTAADRFVEYTLSGGP